jgi:hypothetical protein
MGPEAKGLSISNYEAAWDKPYNPNEPKWVPPPRSALPKGYNYTPPAPPPQGPESHDTSSESELDEEISGIESSEYHTSDSESADNQRENKNENRFSPVFPWEMRSRGSATRVFPGDVNDQGKPIPRPYDRRASLDNYEFTNAYDPISICLNM